MGAAASHARVRVALDHHYSPVIALGLRDRGHDAVTVAELGWHSMQDEPLLTQCGAEGLTLMTNNVADFVIITRRWLDEGRVHAGLIFTSDSGWPRGRETIGRFIAALDTLMANETAASAFADRVHWL